ncbi:MAG: efflux RND transporter permease subunit, partial [Pseudomonadota bacterium]|nr:efflux RND transporter permease subunit [Pseudomonadota bacterium]
AFKGLPLREYPDIDPPIVSIDTTYIGASAETVETRITEVIEDRISGVEGIQYIASTSSDGRSRINIEFSVERDIDAAANDIRDRVSGVLDNLPDTADPPDIQKADSSDDVILWLNLVSDKMNTLELTDYAERYLQDRFSVLPGVARVRIGGGLEYAMRVWLDREKMAATGITVKDVQDALRSENIELPAGQVESDEVQFTARIERAYSTEDDFKKLVISRRGDQYIRLSDIATVKKSAIENRTFFRGNGVPMIGIGIIKQSKANTIEVANAAVEMAKRLEGNLPAGMEIINSYDTSVFIKGAIEEVYKTLFLAAFLVVLVIYIFLGSVRSMLIPAVTVPISVLSTFIALYFFGFSINLLTLLALVLSIGLVVDDAIVVLENVYRRIEEGEHRLVAAYKGARQVGFAVIATTVVTAAVFVPVTFLKGDLGRLFTEFSVTLIAAVCFSTFVALTLCPMLASKVLKKEKKNKVNDKIDQGLDVLKRNYRKVLHVGLKRPALMGAVFFALIGSSYLLFKNIPSEYAPKED